MVKRTPSSDQNAEGTVHLPAGGPTMERTKKKVEWRNNHNSDEHDSLQEDRSPMWDHETGHLLSYFLGDQSNQGNGGPSPPAHYSTTPSQNKHATAAPSYFSQPMHNLFRNRSASNPEDFGDDPVPPPTPATQYYHHSKPKAKPLPQHQQKASNNPLIKMKVSFASDSAHPGDNNAHPEAMSPISPTSMIGPLQEQLMLPPPSSNTSDNNQSHLSWLQHINALAKASAKQGAPPQEPYSITSIPPPPGVNMPQPISYSNGIAPVQPIATNPMFYSHVAKLNQQIASGGESEEKRARRLERNRESARKSRRRKKERLSTLEEKVANLYQQIETERRKQINSMDDALAQNLQRNTEAFRSTIDEKNELETKEQLAFLLQATGPDCKVRRAVVDFQYSALKQLILPRYQKFLLWLTLHSESYYSTGREIHQSRQDGKQIARLGPGKVSSKQVGEELTNGTKLEGGTDVPQNNSIDNGEKPNQTAGAFDKTRMWPLLCFELSISVDQEEKYMAAYTRVRQLQTIDEKRSQIAAATKMASNLKEAMLYQSHNAAMRNKRCLIDILTPQQTVKYQQWIASNRNRCKEKLLNRKEPSGRASPASVERSSLMDVCKRLEQVVISQESNRTEK
eukprot:scaffold66_cov115-Cylindrotheca_fusiformis.AAC.7